MDDPISIAQYAESALRTTLLIERCTIYPRDGAKSTYTSLLFEFKSIPQSWQFVSRQNGCNLTSSSPSPGTCAQLYMKMLHFHRFQKYQIQNIGTAIAQRSTYLPSFVAVLHCTVAKLCKKQSCDSEFPGGTRAFFLLPGCCTVEDCSEKVKSQNCSPGIKRFFSSRLFSL